MKAKDINHICPICREVQDITVVFTEDDDTTEVIVNENACGSCEAYMEEGFIVIGFIPEKTVDQHNPYRSGHLTVVSEDFFIDNDIEVPPVRVIYINYAEGIAAGIFKKLD